MNGKKIRLEGEDAQCLIDLIETPIIAADIKSENFRHYYLNTHPEGQTEEEWQKTLSESEEFVQSNKKEAQAETQDQDQENPVMASA